MIVASLISMRARGMALALSRSEEEATIASRTEPKSDRARNRAGINALMAAQGRLERCRMGQAVVAYLDVNDFKAINDSIGHHGGDQVIVELGCSLRGGDLRPGRPGTLESGDEFLIVMTGPDVVDDMARLQ